MPAPTIAEVKALAAAGRIVIGQGDMVFAAIDARGARNVIARSVVGHEHGDFLTISDGADTVGVTVEDGVVVVGRYSPGGFP